MTIIIEWQYTKLYTNYYKPKSLNIFCCFFFIISWYWIKMVPHFNIFNWRLTLLIYSKRSNMTLSLSRTKKRNADGLILYIYKQDVKFTLDFQVTMPKYCTAQKLKTFPFHNICQDYRDHQTTSIFHKFNIEIEKIMQLRHGQETKKS